MNNYHWMQLAKYNITLLLLGEPGSGKSSLAKKIHENSLKSKSPFIQVNMAAISPQLFESELFGHLQGSFTGANQRKIGFCEVVKEGTLFLDEIGELNLDCQAKLLQLLEEKIFYPVGSTLPIFFKGRIIFATNRNLEKLVQNEKFRLDLWHRIKNYEIKLPSLSEDKESKIMAIEYWINFYSKEFNKDMIFTSEAYHWLVEQNFPGNYREVRMTIEKIFVLCSSPVCLKEIEVHFNYSQEASPFLEEESYPIAKKKFERAYLKRQLSINHGKINQTAKNCGISKVSLIQKIREHQLHDL